MDEEPVEIRRTAKPTVTRIEDAWRIFLGKRTDASGKPIKEIGLRAALDELTSNGEVVIVGKDPVSEDKIVLGDPVPIVESVTLPSAITQEAPPQTVQRPVAPLTEEIVDIQDKVLPTVDFSLIKDFVDTHTSLGADCVPLSATFLYLIGEGVVDRESQEKVFEAVSSLRDSGVIRVSYSGEKKVYKKGDFLSSSDDYGARFLLGVIDESLNPDTGYFLLDSEAETGDNEWGSLSRLDEVIQDAVDGSFDNHGSSYSGHPIILFNLDRQGLTGKVVYSNPDNPYFQRFPDGYKEKGSPYQPAGMHELLLLDFDKTLSTNEERTFYFLDPQTGVVFSTTGDCLKQLGVQLAAFVGLGCIANNVFTKKIVFGDIKD